MEISIKDNCIKIGDLTTPLNSVAYKVTGDEFVQLTTLNKLAITPSLSYGEYVIDGEPAESFEALIDWLDANIFVPITIE